jgi:hypothetical protein
MGLASESTDTGEQRRNLLKQEPMLDQTSDYAYSAEAPEAAARFSVSKLNCFYLSRRTVSLCLAHFNQTQYQGVVLSIWMRAPHQTKRARSQFNLCLRLHGLTLILTCPAAGSSSLRSTAVRFALASANSNALYVVAIVDVGSQLSTSMASTASPEDSKCCYQPTPHGRH